MNSPRDPEVFVWALMAIGILGILIGLAVNRLRRASRSQAVERDAPASTRPVALDVSTGADPLCPCGAIASRPISRTYQRRGVLDELRDSWGLPPRYGCKPATELPPTLCELHGRVFDAKLRSRLAEVVMSARAKAEEQIAVTMAAVESETLSIDLAESMTKAQQSALKKRVDAAKPKPAAGADVISITRAANGE